MQCDRENDIVIKEYYPKIISKINRTPKKNFKTQVKYTDTIYNIIKNVYKVDFIECNILACIYSKILKSLRYKETTVPFHKLYSLKPGQFAIVKLVPPIDEYHFLLIIPQNDNFRIYSAYGKKYIKPYTINQNVFKKKYNDYMNAKNGNKEELLKYNENTNSIGIVKLWKKLTKHDSSKGFDEMVKGFGELNDDEEDWIELMDDFKERDKSLKNDIFLYKRTNKNKTNKK